MHLLFASLDDEEFLRAEIARNFPATRLEPVSGRLFAWKGERDLSAPLPPAAFCRQMLPGARFVHADSIGDWAQRLFDAVTPQLPEDQPWSLHLLPEYGDPRAGLRRCELVWQALAELLRRKRRQLGRGLQAEALPWSPRAALVQLVLTRPDGGFLSVAPGPLPWCQRAWISPFPAGEVPVAVDKAAPSRAFAKLLEAELRLGRGLAPGEVCVDLGAAPGSWSYVAVQRGARVLAVDRSPLRDDLMRSPQVTFHRGDAFAFVPPAPVDWLLCDVIAAPQRSVELLVDWVRERRARHFVVSLKFKGAADLEALAQLQREVAPHCDEWRLARLCANRNEACAFGSVRMNTVTAGS